MAVDAAGPAQGWTWENQDTPSEPQSSVMLMGRRSAATGGEPEGIEPSWFETHLRPQLEAVAHPQSLADIMHLVMAPTDATRSIGLQLLGKAVSRASEALGGAAETGVGVAKTVAKEAAKKLGIDPDAIEAQIAKTDLATTRLRLQAARSQTRQAEMLAAQTPTSPAGSVVAPARPGAPPAAAQPAAAVAPAQTLPQPVLQAVAALKKAGYSDAEVMQAAKWVQEGVPPAKVIERIEATRKLQASGSFANLPTVSDVAQAVAERNATKSWPSK